MMDKVALLGLLAKEIQLNVSIRSATVAREATWWLQYTLVVSGSCYSFNLMNEQMYQQISTHNHFHFYNLDYRFPINQLIG